MKRLTNIILILIFLILAFAILHMIVSKYTKEIPMDEVEPTFTMIQKVEEIKTEEVKIEEVTVTFTEVIPDIYKEFLKNFDEKGNHYYYSIATMDNYKEPVLLISDGTYNYSREDASSKQAAMWADVYYYIEDSVTYLGHISSSGTAYPVAADNKGFLVAGNHHVKKYKIDIEDKNLYLVFNYTEYFRNIDNKIESTYILQKNEKNEVTTQEEYDIAFAEYTVGKVILFYELK